MKPLALERAEVVVGCEDGLNSPRLEGGGVFPQGVDKTESGYGIEGLVLVWFWGLIWSGSKGMGEGTLMKLSRQVYSSQYVPRESSGQTARARRTYPVEIDCKDS